MEPKTEAVMGTITVTVSTIGSFLHDISPILSFIAILTGAILGCHGVYHIIHNWWKGKPNNITHIL